MHRTDKLKGKVWRFVRALFTEPDMLRADLDAMIEEERRSYQRLTVKGLVANLESTRPWRSSKRPERLPSASWRPCRAAASVSSRWSGNATSS